LSQKLKEEITELTSEMKPYRLEFEVVDNTSAALRLEFINNGAVPERGDDRDVWLEAVRLERIP